MWRLLALVTATGCEVLFPRLDVPRSDAAVDGQPPPPTDGGVLQPPVSGDTCTDPIPAFETFTFASTTVPFMGPGVVEELGFYRSSGALRAIMTTGDRMFDVADDGTAVVLAGLDPPPAASMSGLHVTYDGVALWFVQDGVGAGVYLATAADGWVRRRADLGFPNAERIEPGAVGYFASSARMVVSVADVGEPPVLHELSSLDGEHWSEVPSITFATSGLGDRHPALSPDGCYVLYTASNGTSEIRVAARKADGTFGTPQKINAISMASSAPGHPVLTPDQDALWFTANVAAVLEHFRGAP